MTDKSIAQLESEVALHRQRLEAAVARLREARIAASGVNVGDVVRSLGGGTSGQLFRVAYIDARWNGKPWLRGNPRRKDGTWGTAERHLGGTWEKIEGDQA